MSFTPGSSLKLMHSQRMSPSPLDIDATFFKNLSPDVREFLISEGFQILPRTPTENNHQGNQGLILLRNAAVEAENNIGTIKAAVQPASRIRHT